MDGILLINKKAGMTSFDVVSKARKILHEKSIGHTGTLDPNATGLLILLVGRNTKLLPYCNHDHKEYVAQIRLGLKTDTGDIWGNVIESRAVISYGQKDFEKALKQFTGKQKQIPPMVSAIKKDGRKLYELARENIIIEREARDIEVYELECLEYGDTIRIRAIVSGGTYIRTLIEDICESMGNLGTMLSLVRTRIGNLTLEKACDIEEAQDHVNDLSSYELLKDELPFYEIDDRMLADVKNGKMIHIDCNDSLVMLVHHNMIIAAYEKVKENVFKSKRGLW